MKRIGVELDLVGSYGREALRGLMKHATLTGDWEFVMPTLYATSGRFQLASDKLDGVVTMGHDLKAIRNIQRRGIKLVNIAHTLSLDTLQRANIPSVIPNDHAIGELAYHYLRERGFRSFAFAGHPSVAWSLARQSSFEACCKDDELAFSFSHHNDAVDLEWIASLPPQTAILAANDRYAWLAIDACRVIGRRVPEEIAVLGVDDDSLLVDMVRPSLSSIKSLGMQVGLKAGEMLSELLAGRELNPLCVTVAPEGVVSRNSTEVFTIGDEYVVSAVRFIRLNSHRPISVQDVLDEVNISRRNLERRFKQQLGRSLLHEIRRVRIGRACDLLRDTDFDMPRIARNCGFASHVRFSTVFQQVMKTSPMSYRRQHRVT